MSFADWLGWATVGLGFLLTALSIRATLYFWRATRAIPGNWVLHSTLRMTLTITIATLVLTITRVWSLLYGINDATRLIGAAMVLWIMLIPWLKYRVYVTREGDRPDGHVETAIEHDDRVAGDERRSQAEDV